MLIGEKKRKEQNKEGKEKRRQIFGEGNEENEFIREGEEKCREMWIEEKKIEEESKIEKDIKGRSRIRVGDEEVKIIIKEIGKKKEDKCGQKRKTKKKKKGKENIYFEKEVKTMRR